MIDSTISKSQNEVIKGLNSYNNTNIIHDNNTILNEIIHLSNVLSQSNMSINQLGNPAKRQLHLINVYTRQIRDRIMKNDKNKFKWLYKVSTTIRMNDTKLPEVSDNNKPKGYFRKKIKDFKRYLNVIYIEINSKIHNYYVRIRSFCSEIEQYIISLVKYRLVHYIEFLKECKELLDNSKDMIKNLNKKVLNQYAK